MTAPSSAGLVVFPWELGPLSVGVPQAEGVLHASAFLLSVALGVRVARARDLDGATVAAWHVIFVASAWIGAAVVRWGAGTRSLPEDVAELATALFAEPSDGPRALRGFAAGLGLALVALLATGARRALAWLDAAAPGLTFAGIALLVPAQVDEPRLLPVAALGVLVAGAVHALVGSEWRRMPGLGALTVLEATALATVVQGAESWSAPEGLASVGALAVALLVHAAARSTRRAQPGPRGSDRAEGMR